MKITIFSVGSRGDVQPLVALGKELKVRGANIKFLTHLEYKALVVDNGLEYYEIPKNPLNNWDRDSDNSTEKDKSIWAKIEPEMIEWLDVGLKVCEGSDAIIFNLFIFSVGQHIGEKLNIPYFPIMFEPNIPTGAFPSVYSPIKKNMGACFNKLTYSVGSLIFWTQLKKHINNFRKERLGLKPISWRGPMSEMIEGENPFLCCFSSHLVKKPDDWNKNIFISGYYFLKLKKEFQPTKELADFLENGSSPIFFDLGSFSNHIMEKKNKIILDDVVNSGERLIIAAGKMDVENYNLPKETYILENNVPHEWLLPRMKAIIAHGGVGVTHATLRAGIPMIPISIFAGQYYWGQKLFDLNLCTKPQYLRNLKSGDVFEAIKNIKQNIPDAKNLSEYKEFISKESGEVRTAEWIINYLDKN